jgi:hypothetical protein
MSARAHSRLKKAEPVDWHLEILSEDDPTLPPPVNEVRSTKLPLDPFEVWKFEETQQYGALFPITERYYQIKAMLKKKPKHG